jgi:parvulin-like peptidyl-prolyl isomerase
LKVRIAFVIALMGLLVAGCGGGSSASLEDSDVAVVGGQHISKTQFDELMSQAQRSFKTQGRKFPKQGSTDYATIKNQAVTLLVQQAERESKAKDMGVKVSNSDVDKRLQQIKKQYFGGSEKKYQQQLKKQGLTDAQVRRDIRGQLLSEKVFNDVTNDVKVSSGEVHDYYVQHPQLYAQPQSRDVRHILVKTKALADKIYAQLKGGANFATLAKKYSTDPGSKDNGGKLTITRGQTVAPFDSTAFLLTTNQISRPIKTQYGYHVIQPISDVRPPKTTPLKDAKPQIQAQLLDKAKNDAITKWTNDVKKYFEKKVTYATGYAPPPTATNATTTG